MSVVPFPALREVVGPPRAISTVRRVRVMQIVHSLDAGGTERLVIEITKTLQPWADFVVCCLDAPGHWASELTDCGVPVVSLGRRAGFRPGLGLEIARLATGYGIDVLHCHHYSPFVYGQMAALLRRGLHVVFTEHGRLSDAQPSVKRRLINPLLGRLPSAVFAVSSDLRRHMTLEGFAARCVRVIHNGTDPGPRPQRGDRDAARRACGLPARAPVIGAVGRLDPVKDLDTLVRAFAALRREHIALRLVLIGDGPERAGLEERARVLGVGPAVSFLGYRSDVRRLLPAFDVYVNSSIHEGISLTLLEAMAAALPVVATSVGGTPEVVVDDGTGLLVPPRSPVALAAAIGRLLADPDQRASLGSAGRGRVERCFSIDAMTARYLDVYRGLAES